MANNRIFGLDFLRAAAILMVLAANCIYIFPIQNPMVGQLASLAGYLGLEIFFVLSGFLLCIGLYPIFTQPQSVFRGVFAFIKRRLIRIWPLYLLVLLGIFAIAVFMDYDVVNGWRYFVFLQNLSQAIPNFFPESWGLPIIVFAMLLLPFSILLVFHLFNKRNKSILFLITTIALILSFMLAKWIYNEYTVTTDINQWDVSLKTVVIYRMDSVFIGVLFGWWQYNKALLWQRLKWLSAGIGLCGIAFIALGVGYFQLSLENYNAFWNIFYLPMTSLSIAFFLPVLSGWKNSNLKMPVFHLSKISYAVYLVHFSIVLQLMEHYFLATFTSNNSLVVFAILYVVSTLIIGTVLYFIGQVFANNFATRD